MENNHSPFKTETIPEEKIIRTVDYDSYSGSSFRLPRISLPIDLEILWKRSAYHPIHTQRVLVSIKPKVPSIKTLYIAKKSWFNYKKNSHKTGSRLAIGDHSSSIKELIEYSPSDINSIACETEPRYKKNDVNANKDSTQYFKLESSTITSTSSITDNESYKKCDTKPRSFRKCYANTQSFLSKKNPKLETNVEKRENNKVDIATLIVRNTSTFSIETISSRSIIIDTLYYIIEHLKNKISKQERVIRSMDPNLRLPSSDEEYKHTIMKTKSDTERAGCSYIQQYSHIPETSAFQRYAQQTAPLSTNKATTLEKEHNSEQYGRDFTAYDGITARGRRQCASVPCRHDDIPRIAAERVKKMRNKLTPVRDYRLMDTVHYLAQGEFAPRDDGIKLTPSREAVLSDIIWEDVCRTHWPNTRLGRRTGQCDRYSAKYDIQRLIDSLLKERVAHVERRRRRHYKIVKLNHRHENCRPLGKTGDIIVASHKSRHGDEVVINENIPTDALISERTRKDISPRRSPKSNGPFESNIRHSRQCQEQTRVYDDCRPGPSYAGNRSPCTRESTNCYQSTNHAKSESSRGHYIINMSKELMSCSSSFGKIKVPRLLVKKERIHRQTLSKDELNLEQYILLPTLVERTPSNMKRQKKFNQLYHRILRFYNCSTLDPEFLPNSLLKNPLTKDIGLNINVTLSQSAENLSD